MRFVGEFVMTAGLHEDAEARVGEFAVRRNVDDVLQHHVIEQVALHGSVVPTGEVLAEAVAIETAGAGLAAEDAADEVDLAIVSEQVHHFVVEALVEIAPVLKLKVADGLGVLELADLGGEFFDFGFERAELFISSHERPFLKRADWNERPLELGDRHSNYIAGDQGLGIGGWLFHASWTLWLYVPIR